ncbi:MAG: 5-carboxymethyl-2-hydroxymuconate isomerase [Pseudomonadota bacterium]
MPHIMVDYSPNMEDRTDMGALCETLRRAAAATDVFPLAGIRVRAFRADHVAQADGAAHHGYVDISVRLRAGRDLAVRKAAAEEIFEAARAHLGPVIKAHSVALSLEMRDIDPELAPKTGSVRDHLEHR